MFVGYGVPAANTGDIEAFADGELPLGELDGSLLAMAGMIRSSLPGGLMYYCPETVRQRERLILGTISRDELGVDLADVAVPVRRRVPVRHPIDFEHFGLVPVFSAARPVETAEAAMHTVKPIPGVRMTYTDYCNGTPYLDTACGIGLTLADEESGDRHLIAVSSAFVDVLGNIAVRQIQDVSGMHQVGPGYQTNGLRNGLDWRSTLVGAWEAVARRHSISYALVQSYVHLPYMRNQPADGKAGYDGVAARRFYDQLPNHNWIKNLAVN